MKTLEVTFHGECYPSGKRTQVKPGDQITVSDKDAEAWLADGRAKELRKKEEPKQTDKNTGGALT